MASENSSNDPDPKTEQPRAKRGSYRRRTKEQRREIVENYFKLNGDMQALAALYDGETVTSISKVVYRSAEYQRAKELKASIRDKLASSAQPDNDAVASDADADSDDVSAETASADDANVDDASDSDDDQHIKNLMELEARAAGINPDHVSYYWYKTENFSIAVKPSILTLDQLVAEYAQRVAEHVPTYRRIKRRKLAREELLVVDIADVHFGKLGVLHNSQPSYDLQIARERVTAGTAALLSRVELKNVHRIAAIFGNDWLHTEAGSGATTSGTKQDMHLDWYEAFMVAQQTAIETIETLAQVADVHVIHCISNHDEASGVMLMVGVANWFRNHPNVTFDISRRHYKYLRYGLNLLGFSHGHGQKLRELPLRMATEARAEWSQTKYGFWYLHHLHHKIKHKATLNGVVRSEKMDNGVMILDTASVDYDLDRVVHVEHIPSPSGTDTWHHFKGYDLSPAAMEVFTHHPTAGQIGRFTHLF